MIRLRQPITLEHLRTHTAGFEDNFTGMVTGDPAEIQPIEDTLAAHRPARVRPPGQFVAHSNYVTALAGDVVSQSGRFLLSEP